MRPAQRERQPWPMKWIVLAIVLCLVPYTYLTLHFRKPGPMFRPYQDTKDRVNTGRLLSAGFQRIPLEADRPAEPLAKSSAVSTAAAPGGLPPSLVTTLIEQPMLPAEIISVTAAPVANTLFPYPIEFTCTLPDNKQQLGGAQLYLRSQEIFILPDFERLNGSLLSRSRENLIRLTVPAGALKPGRYRVTLIGARSSKSWTLQVN